MKLEDVDKLLIDEHNGSLRNPINLCNKSKKEIIRQHKMFELLVVKIIENPNRKNFISSDIGRCIMRTFGITGLKNIDERYGIYQVKTIFGDFTFFDSHRLFPTGKYPSWIESHYCFSNTFSHVLSTKLKSKIVSGIAYYGEPFLHSVIESKDMVIDFNYNIVITKDIYYKVFNFEKLNEIDSEDLLKVDTKKLVNSKFLSSQFVLAFEDVIASCDEKVKNEM